MLRDSATAKCISHRKFLIFHQLHFEIQRTLNFDSPKLLDCIPKHIVQQMNIDSFTFFSIRVLFHRDRQFPRQQEKGRTILIRLYNFHLLMKIQAFICQSNAQMK